MVILKTLEDIDLEDDEAKNSKTNNPGSLNVPLADPLTGTWATRIVQPKQTSDSNLPKMKTEDTEQMKILEHILLFFRFCGFLLGPKVRYDWNYKKDVGYYVCSATIAATVFSIIYTGYNHIASGDYIRVLEPLALSGLTISCYQKNNVYPKHWKKIVALLYFTRKLCRLNTVGSRAEIVKSGISRTLKFIKIYAVGVVACTSFALVIPIKTFVVDHELIPVIPVDIVFCDVTKISGFIATSLVQGFMAFYAAVATIMFGATFILCIANYNIQVDLLAEDFKDLDKMWNGTIVVSVAYRHEYLKNICRKRQDMNDYLMVVKLIYEGKLFFYFCVNYFSQIICLFEITQNDWLAGYGPALGLFVEMMFYCTMGTQLSISGDKVHSIICDTDWYIYDQQSKRIIQFLLHGCEKPKELQLGVIGPLNVVTGIGIVKSIYTYYMVLTELL